MTGEVKNFVSHVAIYPASHYIVPAGQDEGGHRGTLRAEADGERVEFFRERGQASWRRSASRSAPTTILKCCSEIGFCKGIENYSRVSVPASAPGSSCPARCWTISPRTSCSSWTNRHVTLPQVRGMYGGDRSRKKTLVDYGFRLPSALDNRPLNFDEFYRQAQPDACMCRATPGESGDGTRAPRSWSR